MRALSAAQALKTDTWKVELVKLARKACRCNSYVEVYLFLQDTRQCSLTALTLDNTLLSSISCAMPPPPSLPS